MVVVMVRTVSSLLIFVSSWLDPKKKNNETVLCKPLVWFSRDVLDSDRGSGGRCHDLQSCAYYLHRVTS
eukprot:scaffold16800_cov41-Attheya_sp.AAC.4